MRLSRPCYDKIWRCPGWNGGGPKSAKHTRCEAGRIQVTWSAPAWQWRFFRCDRCDVIVWPYITRYLSVPWWWHTIRWAWKNSR